MTSANESYDHIIVGAGSAGCLSVNRLSENAANRVLLLEAGAGGDINPRIHIPVGYFKSMHNPRTDWCYMTEPDEGIDEYVPGHQFQSDEELLHAARLYSQTIYHPTSTCNMGHDEAADMFREDNPA